MNGKVLILTAALFATGSALHALNFTPREETEILDGFPIHYLSFDDVGQRVAYGPPSGWKYTGGPARLSLEDPKVPQAQSWFAIFPNQKPGPLTPESIKTFRAQAQALIPPENQNLTLAESTGQHLVGNRQFYTVNFSYAVYGQPFELRVTYLNLGRETLQIVCSARAADFNDFSAALESSLCSWHWVAAK